MALRKIRAYARTHGPFDVVHGQSSKAGALVRLLGRRYGVVVYTPHCVFTMNPELGSLARLAFGFVERMLAHRTDVLIAVSPDEERHLRELIGPAKTIRCIPNGLAPINWRPRAEARGALCLPADRPVVGFIGRFSPQKNPLLLVRAFSQVVHSCESALLAMAGNGPLEDQARRLAAELGVSDRVVWLGFQNPGDVLMAFDVFALPSRYEGLPYVLLEALQAGLPIVSTPIGGAELCVEEGRNGFVVAPEPGAMATRLGDLLADRSLHGRMAAASRELASRFRVEQMVAATLEVYRDARATREAPRR